MIHCGLTDIPPVRIGFTAQWLRRASAEFFHCPMRTVCTSRERYGIAEQGSVLCAASRENERGGRHRSAVSRCTPDSFAGIGLSLVYLWRAWVLVLITMVIPPGSADSFSSMARNRHRMCLYSSASSSGPFATERAGPLISVVVFPINSGITKEAPAVRGSDSMVGAR